MKWLSLFSLIVSGIFFGYIVLSVLIIDIDNIVNGIILGVFLILFVVRTVLYIREKKK